MTTCDANRHHSRVQRWVHRMMSEPESWEQFRFKDAIYDYENIIAECNKLYEQTPATTKENLFIRATSRATRA